MKIIKKLLDSENYWWKLKEYKYIILHHTWTSKFISWRNIFNYFNRKNKYVSAHYLVETDWKVYNIVPDTNIAWHAWKSQWGDDVNLNNLSIWIEIVSNWYKYTKIQKKAVRELIIYLMEKYKLVCDNVLTHAHVTLKNQNKLKFMQENI